MKISTIFITLCAISVVSATLSAAHGASAGDSRDSAGTWHTTAFHYEGRAGEWVLIHQEIPGPDSIYSAPYHFNVDEVEWRATLATFPPTNSPYAIIRSPATLTRGTTQADIDPTPAVNSNPISTARIIEVDGAPYNRSEVGGGLYTIHWTPVDAPDGTRPYCDNCEYVNGFTAIYGATVPWSLDFSFTNMRDSTTTVVEPTFVSTGDGIDYQVLKASDELGSSKVRGVHTTIETTTPGWSLMQVAEADHATAHIDGIHFANGQRDGTTGLGIGASWNLWVANFGYQGGGEAYNMLATQTDVPGAAHVDLDVIEGELDHVSYLHLPMNPEDFPIGVSPIPIYATYDHEPFD
jgi:hypothetical protein